MAEGDRELAGLLGGLKLTASTSGSARPARPPRKEAMEAFHVYKDELMTLPKRRLPAESETSEEDQAILFKALQYHPNASTKIGCGVKCIVVRRMITPDRKDVCCCIVKRVDGTEEDFSLLRCFGARSWKDDGNHFDTKTGTLSKRSEKGS